MLTSSHDVEARAGVAGQPGRSRVVGGVGAGWQDAAARGVEGADRAGRGRGAVEQRVGPRAGDQPPDLVAVAGTVSRGGGDGVVEGCPAPGPPEADPTGEGRSHRDGDAAYDPAGRHPLERAVDGPGAAGEPSD